MKLNRQLTSVLKASLLAFLLSGLPVSAQTSYTSNAAVGAWNTSRWNNSADAAPYASAFIAGNNVDFTAGNYSFAGMGSSLNVGNINVGNSVNVNFPSINSTLATGGNVRTFTVGTGSVLDFSTQAFSTAAGTGFIKDGPGVLALAGGAYSAGFTLNSGTVIARGVDAFGANASNVLTLNGGTVASNSTRSFSTSKHGGGIVIGGTVQFGENSSVVSIASNSANLTFANNVSLGNANRTLVLGNDGNQGFSGVISNTGSGGITFSATVNGGGRFDITNTANTFTGDININGGEVRFTADGSLGNAANIVIIDGGRFATLNSATYTLSSARGIFVGDDVGTSISTPGTGTLTYDGVIANKTAETGSWAKQGGGTLQLGGVSTYTGSTAVNNGTLRITTGNNRLPTGTTLSLGQPSSGNLGNFDLNGFNQQVAGLNSTTGTNSGLLDNTITSASPATLTMGGSGTYSYGDGTPANSGVITGAISLVKNGSGTQTLGDINTFTGSTTVNGGVLALGNTLALQNSTLNTGSAGPQNVTFTVPGANTYIVGALEGADSVAIGANTLNAGSNNANTTFSAAISGTGNFVKTGAGTMTMTGQSTHTGLTTITQGTLEIGSNPVGTVGSITSSATGRGTLRLNGGGLTSNSTTARTILNPLTILADSTLGDSVNSGTLTMEGGIVVAGPAASQRILTVNSPVIFNGNISNDSGSPFAGITKEGSGAFYLNSAGDWTGNFFVNNGQWRVEGSGSISQSGATIVGSGALLYVDTTESVRVSTLSVSNGGTVNLQGGTLRTNAITMDAGSTFTWDDAVITHRLVAGNANNGTIDRSVSGTSIFEGTVLSVAGVGAGLSTSTGSTLDLGPQYISGGLRYDSLHVDGPLNLSAVGDELIFKLNPFFLRPSGFGQVSAGTLILVTATGGITGQFDTFSGVLSDGAGFNPMSGSPLISSTVDPLTDLDANTWLLEYDSSTNSILFHYNLEASVPEPGTFGLLALGALFLRSLRRRAHRQS